MVTSSKSSTVSHKTKWSDSVFAFIYFVFNRNYSTKWFEGLNVNNCEWNRTEKKYIFSNSQRLCMRSIKTKSLCEIIHVTLHISLLFILIYIDFQSIFVVWPTKTTMILWYRLFFCIFFSLQFIFIIASMSCTKYLHTFEFSAVSS